MTIDDDVLGLTAKEYGENYHNHVIEIYKMYVQNAEKISERRQTANSFFLTLNSAIVLLVGYVNTAHDSVSTKLSFVWIIAIAGMVLSYFWYRLIRSYKDLNSGKYKVIHAMEKQLPLRPYDAEWTALGKGKNCELYLPFTHIEIFVPWVFFCLHLLVFIEEILINNNILPRISL